MSKPITPAVLRDKLKDAIAKDLRYIEECKGIDNPQIIAMKNTAEGRVEAFRAVLESIQGDPLYLNSFSQPFEQMQLL